MHRVDNATSANLLPTPKPVGPNPNGFYQNQTIVEADWLNAVQEELASLIETSGLTLSKTNQNQLLAALILMGLDDASTLYKGIVELATNAETQTGTDAVRAVTPAGLASLYTAANVLAKLLTVDGTGSGLDADLLRGAAPSELNTASTIVKRTAGASINSNVTGNLTGNVTGNVTGNTTGNLAGNVTFTGGGTQLSHYQEGTFTPTIQDNSNSNAEGQTYSVQEGYFTRIGRLVFINGRIDLNGIGTLTGGDIARIAGLPFAPLATTNPSMNAIISFANSMNIGAGEVVSGFFSNTVSALILEKWDTTGGTTNLTITELGSSAAFTFSGCYMV